jgi:hypothetical protein
MCVLTGRQSDSLLRHRRTHPRAHPSPRSSAENSSNPSNHRADRLAGLATPRDSALSSASLTFPASDAQTLEAPLGSIPSGPVLAGEPLFDELLDFATSFDFRWPFTTTPSSTPSGPIPPPSAPLVEPTRDGPAAVIARRWFSRLDTGYADAAPAGGDPEFATASATEQNEPLEMNETYRLSLCCRLCPQWSQEPLPSTEFLVGDGPGSRILPVLWIDLRISFLMCLPRRNCASRGSSPASTLRFPFYMDRHFSRCRRTVFFSCRSVPSAVCSLAPSTPLSRAPGSLKG